MRHQFVVRVGPVVFRVGSAWAAPIDRLRTLYAGYPQDDVIADYTVRLEPGRPWRRWLRPQVSIAGDFMLPEALPVALKHGLLAAEMAMNLQLALGERRFLLLHASSVERDGRVLIMTGESGSGKSTLAALLGEKGWRLMGDEFALICPETRLAFPFPRPISLKNQSVAVMGAIADAHRFGPVLEDTPKGTLRHLRPRAEAIAAMDVPGRPAALIFPSFGFEEAIRPVPASESFMRLTQASTNYVSLAERGFAGLSTLVTTIPSVAIDYPDTATGLRLIDQIAEAM